MALICLFVLAGAYSLQFCSELPGQIPLSILAGVSVLAFLFSRIRLLGAFTSGFVLLAFASQLIINDRLSSEFPARPVTVNALVSNFPIDNGISLTFLIEPIGRTDLPGRIRLSWFEAPTRPALGETWQLELRLRRPRGFSNPGGFDYEGWLFRKGIGATGYVVNGSGNIRRGEYKVDRVSRLRRRFVARIRDSLPQDDASAVLMAVGVGARHMITREQWKRYATTGTSHLMAISGLHIGLAAGGMYVLGWAVLSLFCRRVNIKDRAALVAAAAAYAYAEISGFAVPARRALLMTIIFVLAGLFRRPISPSRLLAICCLAIFISDPLAILAPGFKLSFAAVAILFWHMRVTQIPAFTLGESRLSALSNGMRRLSSTQMALLLGLMTLTAFLFDRVATVAPLVNLLALPIFNLLTVPACLIGMMLDGPFEATGDFLLGIAHRSVAAVLWLVDQASELPLSNFDIARPQGMFVAAMLLPTLWSILPPGWPGRRLAIIAAAAIVLYRPPSPPKDCVDLHVLDVGQGLSLVLQTHEHAAVFDAGPSFRGGSDTGRLVLVPFLKSKGISMLDLLIASHADQDHAGGVRSLSEEIRIKKLLGGETLDDIDLPQFPCRAGSRWEWDGIGFLLVHPADSGRWRGNNASCVLEIRIARHTIILTGDIESPVENLLAQGGLLSPADIVLIPHHGSRTSSSELFVSTVRPRVAIVSAGFQNRWGFPKEDIVNAWRGTGATVLNTAESGAISYRICRASGMRRLALHRVKSRNYWN